MNQSQINKQNQKQNHQTTSQILLTHSHQSHNNQILINLHKPPIIILQFELPYQKSILNPLCIPIRSPPNNHFLYK